MAILVVGVGLSIVADWLGSPFLKSLALVLPCGLAGYAEKFRKFRVIPFAAKLSESLRKHRETPFAWLHLLTPLT